MAKRLITETYNNSYASHCVPSAPNADMGEECMSDKVSLLYVIHLMLNRI